LRLALPWLILQSEDAIGFPLIQGTAEARRSRHVSAKTWPSETGDERDGREKGGGAKRKAKPRSPPSRTGNGEPAHPREGRGPSTALRVNKPTPLRERRSTAGLKAAATGSGRWGQTLAGASSFEVISYLKPSGSRQSRRPSAVSAWGYIKNAMGAPVEPGSTTS
jgi:hypothetical protein